MIWIWVGFVLLILALLALDLGVLNRKAHVIGGEAAERVEGVDEVALDQAEVLDLDFVSPAGGVADRDFQHDKVLGDGVFQ